MVDFLTTACTTSFYGTMRETLLLKQFRIIKFLQYTVLSFIESTTGFIVTTYYYPSLAHLRSQGKKE